MRRYGGGILYAALPLHMQRGCFRIQTHDQQVTKAQLYRCTTKHCKTYNNKNLITWGEISYINHTTTLNSAKDQILKDNNPKHNKGHKNLC